MDNSKESFLAELRQAFAIEAQEQLQTITAGLLELERDPEAADWLRILESVYRAAHSLKGASRAANLGNMEVVAHAMESVLLATKKEEIHLAPGHFDILQKGVDFLNHSLSSPEKEGTIDAVELVEHLKAVVLGNGEHALVRTDEEAVDNLTEDSLQPPVLPEADTPSSRLSPVEQGKPISSPESRVTNVLPFSETVRVKVSKLDSLLLKAEEMLSVKQTIHHHATDVREMLGEFFIWDKSWERVRSEIGALRHSRDKVEFQQASERSGTDFSRLLDFLEWNHSYVKDLENRLMALGNSLMEDHRGASIIVDDILEDAKTLIMIPASTLLQQFPKMVRDIARDQGKTVDLSLVGGDVAVDRRILEDLQPSLMHLLRNCIDHGIEKSEARGVAGKPATGNVSVTVSKNESNRVLIEVSDDGAGIDLNKVLEAGSRQGLIPEAEVGTMAEKDGIALIFKSGISTSSIITDLSGRGLGLAIVQEKVNQLGGNVAVDSVLGEGTTFRIILPLTKATFRGTLIRLSDRFFVVPSVNLERVVRIKAADVKTVENRETISLEESAISLARMHDVLKISPLDIREGQMISETISALVLGEGGQRIAFVVDEILAEQEVLFKDLGQHLAGLKCVSGATVLGSGKVAPILNVPGLMAMAAQEAGAPSRVQSFSQGPAVRQTIIVVEDSLTSRTLLKNILESSGFDVLTAVDGQDGFRLLKTEKADLLVSDVEMPRMNGFELTEKVRKDDEFGELPIVLVTARESRADRERGVEAGANAYIVKSSFDQSNLLDVVRTLL